jgi:hypothetical protein
MIHSKLAMSAKMSKGRRESLGGEKVRSLFFLSVGEALGDLYGSNVI